MRGTEGGREEGGREEGGGRSRWIQHAAESPQNGDRGEGSGLHHFYLIIRVFITSTPHS